MIGDHHIKHRVFVFIENRYVLEFLLYCYLFICKGVRFRWQWTIGMKRFRIPHSFIISLALSRSIKSIEVFVVELIDSYLISNFS